MTERSRLSLPGKFAMLCSSAAGDKNKARQQAAKLEIAEILRSRPLSADELRHLANYFDGKFNRRRGRPKSPGPTTPVSDDAQQVLNIVAAWRAEGVREPKMRERAAEALVEQMLSDGVFEDEGKAHDYVATLLNHLRRSDQSKKRA